MPTDNDTPDDRVKHCNGCNRDLPISSFWKRAGRPSGVFSKCKECAYRVHRDWVDKNWTPSEHGRINARKDSEIGMKWCGGCEEKMPVASFWKSKTTWDGFQVRCKDCQSALTKAWATENIDKKRSYGRAAYHRNPRWTVSKHGISKSQYELGRKRQGNSCAICGIVPPRRDLHLDHCHASGKLRRFLCVNCNRAIGCAGESRGVINKAIDYLKIDFSEQDALMDLWAIEIPAIASSHSKFCPRCERNLPASDFYSRQDKPRGLASHCKLCHKVSRATRRSTKCRFPPVYSAVDYLRRISIQGGVCGICRNASDLDIDHDKKTGLFRYLLCGNCNTMVGAFKENPRIMRGAIAYLP